MKHPPRLYFTSSEELSPHEHPDFRGIPYVEYLSLTEAKELAAKAREEEIRKTVELVNKVQNLLFMYVRDPKLNDAWNLNASYLNDHSDAQSEYLISIGQMKAPNQPSRKGEKDE